MKNAVDTLEANIDEQYTRVTNHIDGYKRGLLTISELGEAITGEAEALKKMEQDLDTMNLIASRYTDPERQI